jgi:phosphopantetheinyl transferase
MPLSYSETQDFNYCWGIWEIQESFEDLCNQIGDPEECKPLNHIQVEEKKREKLAARLVLKHLLESMGEPFVGTQSDNFKKPTLKNYKYPISISHSHNKAVAIIHKNKNIGIDIELIQDKIIKIAPRVFTLDELSFAENDSEKLTILWTIKEVLYKVNGEKGIDFKKDLYVPPSEFDKSKQKAVGILRTYKGIESFDIFYKRHGNHIISYNL